MLPNVMIWRALWKLEERKKTRELAITVLETWQREAWASYHKFRTVPRRIRLASVQRPQLSAGQAEKNQ